MNSQSKKEEKVMKSKKDIESVLIQRAEKRNKTEEMFGRAPYDAISILEYAKQKRINIGAQIYTNFQLSCGL